MISEDKVQRVLEAWNDPGRNPAFHAYMQQKLEREWPVLARALDELGYDG